MSTYALTGEIIFPAHKGRKRLLMRHFSECKIERSWQSLTATAEITLPRNVRLTSGKALAELFHEGDPVEIWLGYDGNLFCEFTGYIKNVPAGIPLIISCEDEMYNLKRKTVSVSVQNTSIRKLIELIVPETEVVCDETEIEGSFRFSNQTQAQCLEELQKQGIYSRFEAGKLYASLSNVRTDSATHTIVIEKTAGEGLKQKEIQTTKAIVELIRPKGKKLKIEFGDENAQVIHKRTYSGLSMNESEMRALAERIYKLAKQPGLDGDITLFGLPRVLVGDKLKLQSIFYEKAAEYNGTSYCIDAVTKTFSVQGYRQVCKLGLRA